MEEWESCYQFDTYWWYKVCFQVFKDNQILDKIAVIYCICENVLFHELMQYKVIIIGRSRQEFFL